MIRALARFAVGNPVAVNLATVTLCALGIAVYLGMPREVFPVFSLRTVVVTTMYPGAAPEDVERLVTIPLENELAALHGLEELSSTSRLGVSTITLATGRDADITEFLAEVRAAVQSGDAELPEEAEDPQIREVRTEFPVIAVYVYGWLPHEELRRLAEEEELALEELEGVSQVVVTGTHEPRIWVEVDPTALERYGLTLADIGRAVGGRSRDLPLGSLVTARGETLLSLESGVLRAEDLAELPVLRRPDGTQVPLRAVARLVDARERAVTRARFNGQPCVHLQVNKEADGDTIDIARAVRAHVDAAQARMPAGVAIGANTDLSIYVENRLRVMRDSGLFGGVLVLLSLILFLDLRVALITALGIPVAFVGGVLLAGLSGVTMNMMTMFALIVVLGMIVDDAIVVGENAYRRMEEGEDPETAAIEGTAEVGAPVLATILTTVAAFLPILMLSGTIGQFLRPLPLVVTACLAVSLVEALCVLPSHVAHWHARRPARPRGVERRRWYDPLRELYLGSLRLALRWRYVAVVGASGAAALVAGFGAFHVPFNLFDEFESKLVYVNLRLPAGASLDESERLAMEVERRILALPPEEVESVNVLVGVTADDSNRWELGRNLAQLWVDLREGRARGRSTAERIEALRALLVDLPGEVESTEVAQPQSGPTGKAIDVWVRGPELAVLDELADELIADLESYAGVVDAHGDLELGEPGWVVTVTEAGRLLGVDEAWLGTELRTGFEGLRYGTVRRGRDDVELIVKLPEELRADPASLSELRVSLPGGARVPLSTVAELRAELGPMTIRREERERAVRVVADVDKRRASSAAILASVRESWADLAERRPGYRLVFKGDQQELERSLEGFQRALLMSLVLIFLILGSLFRSVAQPFVIMFVIPFGLIGMVLGHVVMGRTIGLMSLIGLLALTGVVVNDSLILVEFVNQRRRAGAGLVEALVEAGRLRFRPILLTSITTMLGLAPLTFFATGQARFLQPMAISLFFGLATATALVLVLVPCAYAILEDLLALARQPREALGRLRRGAPLHAPSR